MAEKHHEVLINPITGVKVFVSSLDPDEDRIYVGFSKPIHAKAAKLISDIIEARLNRKGITTTYSKERNTIVITGDRSIDAMEMDSHIMCNHALAVMQDVAGLTKKKVPFLEALQQVHYAEQIVRCGINETDEPETASVISKPAEPLMTETLAYSTIIRITKIVLPADKADALAQNFSKEIAKSPKRPHITGDEIANRGKARLDPLYDMVVAACKNIEDKKRRYAVGEIFDALHSAYEGLAKGNVMRRRA